MTKVTSVPYPATDSERLSASIRVNRSAADAGSGVRLPDSGPEVRTFTAWLLRTLLWKIKSGEAHWSGLAFYFERYPHRRRAVAYDAETFFRQLRPAVQRGLFFVHFTPDPERENA